LIPSYLSLIAGTSFDELKDSRADRRSALINTLFFVLGFSVVFTVLGVVLTGTLGLLSRASQIINLVAGIIIIVLGLNFIFDFWKILNVERRVHFRRRPAGLAGSALIGMAFGAGWSPCIGPILASILLLAGTTGKALQAVLLLGVYSLGLGLPFLLTGYFFSFAFRQMQKIKKHLRAIKIASGAFLVAMGALILLGRLQRFNVLLFSLAYRLEAWQEKAPHGPAVLFGSIFLGLSLLILVFYGAWVARRRAEDGSLTFPAALRPARIVFSLAFLALSVLAFTGVFDAPRIISSWLSFQGL
jgi:cytochrome c-type biogenesis protein